VRNLTNDLKVFQLRKIMPVEIRPITHDDIPGAARCIQEAFADDPYNKWVFDKSKVCEQSISPFQDQISSALRVS
jgi:hypothetical protein